MAAMAANNSFHNFDSPPKPSSPASPSINQPPPRTFIHLNQGVRGQHSPFPTTPTSTFPTGILEPPPGMLYSDFIRSWSDNHVARWLNDIKCGHHATSFKANDIRGDIVLELDQPLLKEMGITSIGDRLRILNAVKTLRQRSASRPVSVIDITRPKLDQATEPRPPATPEKNGSDETTTIRATSRGGRPAPLQLNPNINRGDLPRLEPDSATRPNPNTIVRPLPLPSSMAVQPSTQPSSTPGSSHTLVSTSSRTTLPPLPPPPGKPPPPPTSRPPVRPLNGSGSNDRRPPTQSDPLPPYSTQPLHISQRDFTPSPGPSRSVHLPSDPRPGNPGGGKPPIARSTSPLHVGRISRPLATHARNGSLGPNSPVGSSIATKLPPRPSTSNSHPYATATAQLAPMGIQQQQAHNLSPIAESFLTQHSTPGTPSPPSIAYTVGRGSFNPNANSSSIALPLDTLRRKLVKFLLPDEGLSSTIDVATCAGGVEILEKILKKFGKGGSRSVDIENYGSAERPGLNIDGWGVYLGKGGEDGPGMFFPRIFTRCT
jgi:mitogen-activated protein kinase kinase kinase